MVEKADDVYKKFYPNLLEAQLPLDSLSKQLQNINLFDDQHVKELEACDSPTARTKYILDHVIESSLKSGNIEPFDILLKIMKESDNADLILLAKEMKILYNSVPNNCTYSSDEPPDANPVTDNVDSNYCNTESSKLSDIHCDTCDESVREDCCETDHQDHTLAADDEVDGRVKKVLTSVAGAVFPKLKKKHNHPDPPTLGPNALLHERDYSSIKKELTIINKYGRRSQPLGSPWLLAKGAGDKLFVRDSYTHQVVVFDKRLKFSHVIGSSREQFKSIGGIAVKDEAELVYVSDQLLNCIQIFTLDGEFMNQIGHKGTADGEFRSPCGLVLSATESLFVCDSNNHRIQVFHHNNKFAYAFGQRGLSPGSFDTPEALAMNSTEDKLFISSDNRVQVFTTSGKFLKVFDHFNSASHELLTPIGIWCTPDGHVLVSSYGTHCVYVLKEDGTHVSVIKGSYQGQDRFVFPAGVIVRDNGQIVIASSGSHQLAIF